jgi:hypothetical protein
MLSFNLIRVTPQRFQKFITNGTPVTHEDPLEEPRVKDQDICWALQGLDQSLFSSSLVAGIFQVNTNESQYIPDRLKQWVHLNRLPLLMIILQGLVEDICIEGEDVYIIKRFLRAYRQNLLDTLQGPNRAQLLIDLADFYSLLLASASLHGQTEYKKLIKGMEPVPPYLPYPLRRKLLLLSIHPNFREIQLHLQGVPNLHLLHHPLQKKLTPEEVFEILIRIPPTVPVRGGLLVEWDRKVWKLHLFREGVKRKVDHECQGRELLAQIICFMLPNWFQLWPLLFPSTFEIHRRLWDLKLKGWLPKPKEWVELILS